MRAVPLTIGTGRVQLLFDFAAALAARTDALTL
jgi:hypothetical protein